MLKLLIKWGFGLWVGVCSRKSDIYASNESRSNLEGIGLMCEGERGSKSLLKSRTSSMPQWGKSLPSRMLLMVTFFKLVK